MSDDSCPECICRLCGRTGDSIVPPPGSMMTNILNACGECHRHHQNKGPIRQDGSVPMEVRR